MAYAVGLRQVKVIEAKAGEKVILDNWRGSFVLTEVTNATDAVVYFEVNANESGGHPGVVIPILPKTTRTIPVMLFAFTATGPVTVVAYGM